MSAWAWVENERYTDLTPRLLEAECHDRSAFVTIACNCGEEMHVHETQIAGHEKVTIGAPCKGCGETLLFPPGVLPASFADLRKRGWIR